MVKLLQLLLMIGCSIHLRAQTSLHSVAGRYMQALEKVKTLLEHNGAFKEAVLITEQAYYADTMNYDIIDVLLTRLEYRASLNFQGIQTRSYHAADSVNYKTNKVILQLFKETPLLYNRDDPFGERDWSHMFVTSLLSTQKGNCHSLAYLYKILADELGATCWLSLAPHHLYIRNYSNKTGWYNTELTSASFPTDAWIMATGYVSPQAIKSGLYMDTLSNQQAIALCVLDLAKGYEFQTGNYYDGFIINCCNLVLQYHPVNPMALLLKAETLKKVYLKEQAGKTPAPTVQLSQIQEAYRELIKLGYREMPPAMYQQWLQSITTNKEKYTNTRL
jgi:hypothetical protein